MQKYRLGGLPFSPAYEVPGHDANRNEILKRIGEDFAGIGFAALGMVTPNTKVVALADREGGDYSTGSAEDVVAGRYPLTRDIWFSVRREPGQPLVPWVKEYLRLVLSKEGQEIVAALSNDHLPLSAREAAEERAKLDPGR
jgi:phosphate transport system substrate-binding protein